MGFWGIFQYAGIANVYYAEMPVTGSFENPTGLAIFLSALFPASLFFTGEQGKWGKIWGYLACLLIAFVILISNSRTGILSMILICILYFFRNVPFRWNGILKKYLLPGIFLCVVLLFVGLYYWKENSANGRILIWLCSLNMFQDHWLLGIGHGKFQAEYMLYQAEYFRQYPDSMFAVLADNVKHPFNEYLKILVEYGILGFSLFAVTFVHLIKVYNYNRKKSFLFPVFGSILAVALAACFSYPLNYPVITFVLVSSVAIVNTHHFATREIKKRVFVKIVAGGLVVFAFIFSGILYLYGRSEFEWNVIARASLRGKTKEMLPHYRDIYRWMKRDGLFLYNYGAELQQGGEYAESIKILEKCNSYFNDVDLQLLLAENYCQLGMYTKSETCLRLASDMCPVRFVPLYKLMNIYVLTGEIKKARHYAEVIIDKPVKIYSGQIDRMKNKAKEVLVRFENSQP